MTEPKTKPSASFLKGFFAALIAAFVFAIGYSAGSGRLTFADFLNRTSGVNANKDLPGDLDYSEVEQVYDSLRENFAGELDAAQLLEGLKDGLAQASGDPYTEYLDAGEAADFEEGLSGTFSGIGAELSKDENYIVIVAPIAGFPAEKAGLRAGDVITEIDGDSAFNLSVSEAVNKIRGPKGEKVKLTVIRNESERLGFEITRDEIKIPSVESEIKDGIGYLTISRYGDDTAQLSRQAAQEFSQANVQGVVLDLRNNPGGLLDAAVDVAGLWLDNGAVVLEEKRDDVVVRTFRAEGAAVLKGVPTVVLINEGSASASEITAGALADHNVATLIGVKTFGKGSVQSLIDFNNGSQLKVTIAKWFTPNGRNIDQEGIEPDKKVEISAEASEAGRDPQLDAARAQLRR